MTPSRAGPITFRVARQWPAWTGKPGRDYLAVISFPVAGCLAVANASGQNAACPFTPDRIVARAALQNQGNLVIWGLSLIDRRTGAHQSVTVSPAGDFRRIHSGDVKIYERKNAPGRAWLVHGIQPAKDDVTALSILADPDFDPRATAVVTGASENRPAGAAASGERVTVLAWEAERIALAAEVVSPAILVLADSDYPGWQATVDGTAADILRANYLFRGIALEPGSHEIVFTYAPASWRWGVMISAATLLALIGALVVARHSGT
jgi:hypothetical protein